MSEDKGVKAGRDRILIPEGLYEAQAVKFKVVPFKNSQKIYLKLNILTVGEYFGSEIWIVFQAYSKRYGARSKFYKAWVIAHDRKPDGCKIKPADLCGKIYQIRTRTVLKDEDGEFYPPVLQYSVAKITRLIQDAHQLPTTNYRLPTLPSLSDKGKKGGSE